MSRDRSTPDAVSPEDRELLAYLLEQEDPGGAQQRIRPRQGDGDPPPSFAQHRLWIVDQLSGHRAPYTLTIAMRARGRLDPEALRWSLGEITRRHEILRTTFALRDGEIVQVVGPAEPVTLEWTDLRDLPESEREQEAGRRVREARSRSFDLARGPLFQFGGLRLGDRDHVLILHMHHSVFDGWSMRVLVRELSALYAAAVRGEPSPLLDLPIQYADFAVWQRQWMDGEVLERELEMRELARQESATLFMTLLAAFKVLLSRYAGQTDISVGSPAASRNREEIEELIGFFVNMLVLRTDLSGDPSFRELVGRVRETAVGGFAHADAPFEKLVEELAPERDLSRSPLFQVTFGLNEAPMKKTVALPDLELGMFEFEDPAIQVRFDLEAQLWEQPDGVRVDLGYRRDLYDASTIRRLLGHYRTLVEGIASGPDARISDLPLLTEPERRQMLVEWNATALEVPEGRCVHELVAEQAARDPEALAVRDGEQALTYGELNRLANRLAHFLRAREVGPDVAVGLCTERGVDLVVGALGVLKAGGAYVPLDPTYPRERLVFMLEDADVGVLLTQEHLLGLLGEAGGAEVLCLDRDASRIAAESEANPTRTAGPENLAYVIYGPCRSRAQGSMRACGSCGRIWREARACTCRARRCGRRRRRCGTGWWRRGSR
jgi:hypothetical protein